MLKKVYCIATARSENRKCKGYAMLGKKCCYIHRAQEPTIERKIEVKQSPVTNGACQVIKGDDKKCKNYARKGLTCCWSHRALENTEYVPEPETEPETEPESEPERHACCCLTMKGNPCAIVAEHVRGDKKYCWRHWREIEVDSESDVIELLFC